MNEFFKIGQIVKPQGIKGQLKVQPLTDDINRFKSIKEVIIDGQTKKVASCIIAGGFVIMSLDGVSDRNLAELYRGKFILVTRENAVSLSEGRYFIADLIGLQLFDNTGAEYGKIVEVVQNKTDIIVVKCINGKVMSFPFLKKLNVNVDLINGKMTVERDRLCEVCLYEN